MTFTQRFYYSAYPVLACYWHFPLLDISRYCLLHNVSYTRHIQWQSLVAILLEHSITWRFNYSMFQRFRAKLSNFCCCILLLCSAVLRCLVRPITRSTSAVLPVMLQLEMIVSTSRMEKHIAGIQAAIFYCYYCQSKDCDYTITSKILQGYCA